MSFTFLIEAFFIALSGVPVALLVTAVSLLIALPISFLLALSRINEVFILKQVTQVYVSFVRGTPTIVQIFVIYNSIPLMLNMLIEKYSLNIDIYSIHPLWYAFIIFGFNTTAILSEVFRSALTTVDKGQLEACQSVGLTTFQSYKRIIIPQVLVVAIPNLSTATINLVKATSLGYAISLQEITLKTKVAANTGYHYLEAYIDIFIVYLILCSIIEYLFKLFEVRLSKYKGVRI
ncbi:MAG TPA: amino acid ABC transporter permease [Pseudogracilibacillus sp.]|nr:amino acid ABC transporter permease [Pseudogracilibacillus sp.]